MQSAICCGTASKSTHAFEFHTKLSLRAEPSTSLTLLF